MLSLLTKPIVLTSMLALAGASAGCAGDTDIEAHMQSDAEPLRALRAGELKGSINFGETKRFDYGPNYFEAYAINAGAGDYIRARVQAPGSNQPMLWLTDSAAASRNLAVGTTSGNVATVDYMTPRAGTYYLVVRDAALQAGAMTLSVKARGVLCDPDNEECGTVLPRPCDPDNEDCGVPPVARPSSTDPFEPGSCSGAPLTEAQAAALLRSNGAGTTVMTLGTPEALQFRQRSCNVVTGCGPWTRYNGLSEWGAAAPAQSLKLSVKDGRNVVLAVTGPDIKRVDASSYSSISGLLSRTYIYGLAQIDVPLATRATSIAMPAVTTTCTGYCSTSSHSGGIWAENGTTTTSRPLLSNSTRMSVELGSRCVRVSASAQDVAGYNTSEVAQVWRW